MEVRHDEGIANRIVPKPCIGGREASGEASVGDGTGQPLSRDRNILGADAACSYTPTTILRARRKVIALGLRFELAGILLSWRRGRLGLSILGRFCVNAIPAC